MSSNLPALKLIILKAPVLSFETTVGAHIMTTTLLHRAKSMSSHTWHDYLLTYYLVSK